jgi:hypothetical protein
VPQGLDYFKKANDNKSYNFVHCWTELKYCCKWELSYEVYKQSVNICRGNHLGVVNLDNEGPSNGSLHTSKGQQSSKADLKRYASALDFCQTLKNLMAKKE